MKSISDLLNTLTVPDAADVTITSEGYAIWITWYNELNSVIPQTFQDYGGLFVAQEDSQALWFFFNTDILLALAKVFVWSKFNPSPLSILAFSAMLFVDVRRNLSFKIDSSLSEQKMAPSESMEIWVHPKLQEIGHTFPGMQFQKEHTNSPTLAGLAPLPWSKFVADTRLPYTSSQGWYAVIHPLGSPLDKNYQAGWRAMFVHIEEVLQKLKLKYSIFDSFLIIPVDNLRQLRNWIREAVQTFFGTKEAKPEEYWPCVNVVIDKRGLNFNNELPQKINIKWDNLTPDFPYMSYRNAYLLGEGFMIQDLHFSGGTSSIDNWCTINLEEYSVKTGIIPVLHPSKFVSGSDTCFYCGIKSHDANHCPSKQLASPSLTFWQDFNNVDIEDVNAAFRIIEVALSKKANQGYREIIEGKNINTRVLEGVLNVTALVQLRSVERIWLLSGKDIMAPVDEQAYVEDSLCWSMLERLQRATANDLTLFEKDLLTAINRTPRDWRLKSLLGFVAVEKGDYPKAIQVWKEAEAQASAVLHQGWHYFLQARAFEMMLRFNDATDLYETVHKLLPNWTDPEYRKLVCRVKMGFAEQVQGRLVEMVEKDPALFNRIVLDPELERGQIPILTALYPQWIDALKQASSERTQLLDLLKEINLWFPPEHPIASIMRKRLENLVGELEVRNYLAFQNIMKIRPMLENELNQLIEKEIHELKNKFKGFLATLEVIRDEAAWFPLPKLLVDFNKNFNECAGILNWAFGANFRTAESFKRAQSYINPITDLLSRLENKLKVIRTIRDSTLFGLILIRNFLWIEIISLVLCFIIVPVIVFYGDAIGLGWLQRIIKVNFWELQKVLIGMISVTALGISAFRTTLVFEKKRDEMMEKSRAQREIMQQKRLQRIYEAKSKMKNADGYIPTKK